MIGEQMVLDGEIWALSISIIKKFKNVTTNCNWKNRLKAVLDGIALACPGIHL
jgi:hypothetical protein